MATPYRRRFWSHAPLFGVALAATSGVLIAEAARRFCPPEMADVALPWVGDGLLVSAVFYWLARRGMRRFWLLVLVAFGALHLYHSASIPAAALASRLAPGGDDASGARVVHAFGRVADAPRKLPSFASGGEAPVSHWRFAFDLESAEVEGFAWPCQARVNVDWRQAPEEIGEGNELELTGLAAPVAPPRNPGEFDYASWERRRGIRTEIQVTGLADGRVLSGTNPLAAQLDRFAARCHAAMERVLQVDLADDPAAGAIVCGMLLGLHDDPTLAGLAPIFQRTGTLHFFAIDGLKLGLVALLLLQSLSLLGLTRVWAGLLSFPLVFAYAFAAGFGPASLRAVIVASVLLVGRMIDRPARPLNSLGAAALLLLLFNTNQLFEFGFQLTFLVVFTILLLTPRIENWLLRFGAPDPFIPTAIYGPLRRGWEWLRRRGSQALGVAIAAWLGSLPIMLLTFGLCSPISPVANFLAFPLACAIVALGLLAIAGAGLSQTWVAWINNANWLAAHVFLLVAYLCDACPGSSFSLTAPSTWHFGAAPLAEITVLDLGRARALHLRSGSHDWLIDVGRPGTYERSLRAELRDAGVARLDGCIITQADADHLSAAALLFTDFHPDEVFAAVGSSSGTFPRALRDAVDGQRRTPDLHRVARGDELTLAPGVTARLLYPPAQPPPPPPLTAASRALVPQLCVTNPSPGHSGPSWRVLLLPDTMNGRAATWLLAQENADALRSTVLVTDDPPPAAFATAVGARVAVVRPRKDAALSNDPQTDNTPWSDSPVTTFYQVKSGAVTLRYYRDRLEVRGYVDGRTVTIRP